MLFDRKSRNAHRRLLAFCAALLLALPLRAAAQSPAVFIEALTVEPFAGEAIDLSFRAGSPDAPVSHLFGVAFELSYSDGTYLIFNTPEDALAGDFLQPDVYTFTRHEPANRVFYLAVSRKRGATGQSGSGIVLSLPVRVSEEAPVGWQTCFTLRNIIANDSLGTPITLQPGPTVCIRVSEPEVEVVPNPITPNDDGYNDEVEFRRDGGIPPNWVIQIMDRTGLVIRQLSNGEDRWNGRDEQGKLMLPGAYLYTIRDGKRLVKRGVLGIIR